MFSEILKIFPKVDGGDLNKMERSLSTRFARVAKKFGKGLLSAITGGGVVGAALGILDKLLNPLQNTQEAIDKILHASDDLSTYAREFNTTSGNLFKLQKIAQAKGLDAEGLNQLLGKFQTAVAEALKDPNKDTSVRNFAVKGADTAEQFLKFIQANQRLGPEQRTLAENEVFGGKQSLKAAELLNTTSEEFAQLLGQLGLASGSAYTAKIDKGAKLSDFEDILKTKRDVDNFLASIDKIAGTDGTKGVKNLFLKDENDRNRDKRERDKIDFYDSMIKLDSNVQVITAQLETVLLQAGKGITSLEKLVKVADKLPAMKALKGIFGYGKSGD